MNRAGEFIKIFEKHISLRWWRTHLRPHASFKKSRFYHIKHRFNNLSIVGNDVKGVGEYLEVWIVDVDNLFLFLNILWKYDELKKQIPYCVAWVFFGSGDCDLNSFLTEWTKGMCAYWQRCLSLLFILYMYSHDKTGIARFFGINL